MTRLLIQCQGNSGPLSFTVEPAHAATILECYHQVSEHTVVPIVVDGSEIYYINLALVSWIQSWTPTKENKSKPRQEP